VEAADAEKRQKDGRIDVSKRILQDTSLETIKVVRMLPKDAFLKLKNRDGIPVVSNSVSIQRFTIRTLPSLYSFLIFYRITKTLNRPMAITAMP